METGDRPNVLLPMFLSKIEAAILNEVKDLP